MTPKSSSSPASTAKPSPQERLKILTQKSKRGAKPAASPEHRKFLHRKSDPPTGKPGDPQQQMLTKLAESGLDAKDAAALGFEPCTAEQVAKLGLSRNDPGFVIPYVDENRNPLPMYRLRYFDTVAKSGFLKGTEQRKYDQPSNTLPDIYLPHLPGTDWSAIADDVTAAVAFDEGELKSASVTKYIMPCIGLGGVFNFASKKLGIKFLASLERFKWKGRKVYIIYDADKATNPFVLMAANRLARLLTERGALVYVVDIPQEGREKIGADDYIRLHGKGELEKLIAEASLWENCKGLFELDSEILYVQTPSCIAILPHEGESELELIRVKVAREERFANRFYKNELNKDVPAFPEWFLHRRRSVKRIDYAPGEDLITRKGNLNGWRGWPFAPVYAPDNTKLWVALLDYIFKDGTPEFRKWVEMWIAYPMQYPGTKMFVALVLWSLAKGTGKTLLGYLIMKLYGIHGIELDQPALMNHFNAFYAGRVSFVVGAELLGADSRKTSDTLKHLITGHTVTVEQKFIPAYNVPNCMNSLLTSNHPNAVYADDKERRYAVHEIKGAPMPSDFYKPYDLWLHSSVEDDVWSPAVFHRLLHLDTSTFNPHAHAPLTEAFAALVDANRTAAESWAHELRVNPEGVPVDPYSPFKHVLSLHTAEELLTMFGQEKHHTVKSLALALRAEGFEKACKGEPVRLNDGKRLRLWIVRGDRDYLVAMNAHEIADVYVTERNGKVPKFARSAAAGRLN